MFALMHLNRAALIRQPLSKKHIWGAQEFSSVYNGYRCEEMQDRKDSFMNNRMHVVLIFNAVNE